KDGSFVVAAPRDAPFYAVVALARGLSPDAVDAVRVVADVTIVLGPPRTLSGRVLSVDGEPVAGARVVATAVLDLARFEFETTSGPDGAYRVAGLPSPHAVNATVDSEMNAVSRDGLGCVV